MGYNENYVEDQIVQASLMDERTLLKEENEVGKIVWSSSLLLLHFIQH